MRINIIKDSTWIRKLAPHNDTIKQISRNYKFDYAGKVPGYNVEKGEASEWFDPSRYRYAPLSRTYPKIAPEQWRKEYQLIFYLPNYVTLFVIKELYKDRTDVLIEDCGPGNGNLFFFLSKLGFNNFHAFDKFLQCPKQLFLDTMKAAHVTCKLNDYTTSPVIVNNCSAPFVFVTHGLDNNEIFTSKVATAEHNIDRTLPDLELICFYTNREWEELAPKILTPQGYSFLCKDSDDMGVVWCRNDKLKEFTAKLKPYAIE